ncbi:S-methyl-5'-thioinosine phosphorylase [hydrothermal vent metagenome]|uniref:S-methyl-5'-thioinosine phosphorylase n=1 Tax=hydrothermal vent metagenome TaxID=652676 RepID=A0A3B0X889_9ZZZZ
MKLAIISGSLLKEINGIENATEERIKTPFGLPSDNFTSGEIDGLEVVCFNRHGVSHHIAPHQINYKANMFVLKILDVTHIIAITAVGGISEKMSPMKWVVPDQIIDYTHGRIHTYNDANDAEVQHIDFSYPFDAQLNKQLVAAIEMILDENVGRTYESEATYGVTQGPRLETVAEINRMQRDGCNIVGMTAMPEAAFARELDMKYSMLSLVVNWAAGKGGVNKSVGESVDDVINRPAPAIVSMDEIRQRILEGNETAEKIIHNVIPILKSIE